jgi:hypothetical protein
MKRVWLLVALVGLATGVVALAGGVREATSAPARAHTDRSRAPDARQLVLEQSDLPVDFVRAASGYTSAADIARATGAPVQAVQSLHIVSRYAVVFTRNGATVSTPTVIAIGSAATVLTSALAAHVVLKEVAYGARAGLSILGGAQPPFTRVALGLRIGDETFCNKGWYSGSPARLPAYFLYWRAGRVMATVITIGSTRTAPVALLRHLAMRQQARIKQST